MAASSLHNDQPHHPANPKFGQPTGHMEMDLNPPPGPVGGQSVEEQGSKANAPPPQDPNAPTGRADKAQPKSAPSNADPVGGDLSASAARTTKGETFTTTTTKATREGEEFTRSSVTESYNTHPVDNAKQQEQHKHQQEHQHKQQQQQQQQQHHHHQSGSHNNDNQKTNITGERSSGTDQKFLGTQERVHQSTDYGSNQGSSGSNEKSHGHGTHRSSELPSKGSGTKIYSDQPFDNAPSHNRPVREVEDPGHSHYSTKYHDDDSNKDSSKSGTSQYAKQGGVANIPGGFAGEEFGGNDKGSKKYPDVAPNAPSHHHVAKERVEPAAQGEYQSSTPQHATHHQQSHHHQQQQHQQQPGIPSTADYGVDAYESKAAEGRSGGYTENPVKNATIPGQDPLSTGEKYDNASSGATAIGGTSAGNTSGTGRTTGHSADHSAKKSNVQGYSAEKVHSASDPHESLTGQFEKYKESNRPKEGQHTGGEELHQTTSQSSSKSHHGLMDTIVDKTKNLFGDKKKGTKDSISSEDTAHSGTSGTYTEQGKSAGQGTRLSGTDEALHAGSLNPTNSESYGRDQGKSTGGSGEKSYGGTANPNENSNVYNDASKSARNATQDTANSAQDKARSSSSQAAEWKPSTFSSEGKEQATHTGAGYSSGAAVTGAAGEAKKDAKKDTKKEAAGDDKKDSKEPSSGGNKVKTTTYEVKYEYTSSGGKPPVNDFGNPTQL